MCSTAQRIESAQKKEKRRIKIKHKGTKDDRNTDYLRITLSQND